MCAVLMIARETQVKNRNVLRSQLKLDRVMPPSKERLTRLRRG